MSDQEAFPHKNNLKHNVSIERPPPVHRSLWEILHPKVKPPKTKFHASQGPHMLIEMINWGSGLQQHNSSDTKAREDDKRTWTYSLAE